MSASIQLACNREFRYGTCARSVLIRAATVEDARARAHQAGWRTMTGTDQDFCPACSGGARNPAPTLPPVRPLRPV